MSHTDSWVQSHRQTKFLQGALPTLEGSDGRMFEVDSIDFNLDFIHSVGLFHPIKVKGLSNMGMKMPVNDFNYLDVSEIVGIEKEVFPINVRNQQAMSKPWGLGDFTEFLTTPSMRDGKLYMLPSLMVNGTPLEEHVSVPRVVRELSLQEHCLPRDLQTLAFPLHPIFCELMGAHSFQDFRVQSGGGCTWRYVHSGTYQVVLLNVLDDTSAREEFELWFAAGGLSHSGWFLPHRPHVSAFSFFLNAGETLVVPPGWAVASYAHTDCLSFSGSFACGLAAGSHLLAIHNEQVLFEKIKAANERYGLAGSEGTLPAGKLTISPDLDALDSVMTPALSQDLLRPIAATKTRCVRLMLLFWFAKLAQTSRISAFSDFLKEAVEFVPISPALQRTRSLGTVYALARSSGTSIVELFSQFHVFENKDAFRKVFAFLWADTEKSTSSDHATPVNPDSNKPKLTFRLKLKSVPEAPVSSQLPSTDIDVSFYLEEDVSVPFVSCAELAAMMAGYFGNADTQVDSDGKSSLFFSLLRDLESVFLLSLGNDLASASSMKDGSLTSNLIAPDFVGVKYIVDPPYTLPTLKLFSKIHALGGDDLFGDEEDYLAKDQKDEEVNGKLEWVDSFQFNKQLQSEMESVGNKVSFRKQEALRDDWVAGVCDLGLYRGSVPSSSSLVDLRTLGDMVAQLQIHRRDRAIAELYSSEDEEADSKTKNMKKGKKDTDEAYGEETVLDDKGNQIEEESDDDDDDDFEDEKSSSEEEGEEEEEVDAEEEEGKVDLASLFGGNDDGSEEDDNEERRAERRQQSSIHGFKNLFSSKMTSSSVFQTDTATINEHSADAVLKKSGLEVGSTGVVSLSSRSTAGVKREREMGMEPVYASSGKIDRNKTAKKAAQDAFDAIMRRRAIEGQKVEEAAKRVTIKDVEQMAQGISNNNASSQEIRNTGVNFQSRTSSSSSGMKAAPRQQLSTAEAVRKGEANASKMMANLKKKMRGK